MIRKIRSILTLPERRQLIGHIALDILISLADLVFLGALLFLLNHYTTGQGSAGRWSFFADWLDGKNPLLPIGVFFLLFSGKNLLGYFIFRAQCRYLFDVATRISHHKLLAYLEGSYTNYVQVDTAVHIREISYQPREFAQHVLGGVQQVFTQSLLIVMAVTGIALFNVKLFFFLLLILLPPVFGAFYFLRKRLHAVRVVARSSSEKYLQHLQEALTGYIEGNIYHKREVLTERYLGVQRQFNGAVAEQLSILGVPGRLIEVFAIFGLVLIIGISSLLGSKDAANVLTIGVFIAAAYKIIPGIVKIMNSVGQINTYSFTLDHLGEAPDGVAATGGQVADGVAMPVIDTLRFRGLSFSYPGQAVLDKQDLEIRAGEFVGICGPSGRGKSTILHLLLGFLSPDSGDIHINGAPTSMLTRRAFWNRIAYVKQQPFLLHDTIQYNITLGDEGTDGRLMGAADVTGLLPLIEALPEKWNTVIAENGKNISGGQRQRIAFARALYKGADWLILDEPFSELDEASELEMMDLCRNLTRQGKTVLLITHNRANLSFCNKTILLNES